MVGSAARSEEGARKAAGGLGRAEGEAEGEAEREATGKHGEAGGATGAKEAAGEANIALEDGGILSNSFEGWRLAVGSQMLKLLFPGPLFVPHSVIAVEGTNRVEGAAGRAAGRAAGGAEAASAFASECLAARMALIDGTYGRRDALFSRYLFSVCQ